MLEFHLVLKIPKRLSGVFKGLLQYDNETKGLSPSWTKMLR